MVINAQAEELQWYHDQIRAASKNSAGTRECKGEFSISLCTSDEIVAGLRADQAKKDGTAANAKQKQGA